ncbi:MAG: hypothetical protein Kow0010_15980 [Dehalococcoidia bacterium]
MSLRILHVFSPTARENPFLSPAAANRAWLPDALRGLGHEVIAQEGHRALVDAAEVDVVHLHDDSLADAVHGARATLYTRYRPAATGRPFIALSYRGLDGDDRPAAVIAPAIDTARVPAEREPGDHLAFSFDGRDEFALGAAIAVATRSERPLVIALDESAELSESCAAAVAAGRDGGWLTVERYGPDAFPAAIANAAAYLAFSRERFDMAAMTAMASGTPVVALEGSPASEVIVHGESGLLCGSAREAYRAVEHLDIVHPAHGRSRARVVFDAEAAALQHAALYERLAAGVTPVFRHPELADIQQQHDAGERRSDDPVGVA